MRAQSRVLPQSQQSLPYLLRLEGGHPDTRNSGFAQDVFYQALKAGAGYIEAVRAELRACEHHFPESLVLQCEDLGYQVVRGDAPLPAPDLGHYAVGAHLVAPLLDFDHCSGAMYCFLRPHLIDYVPDSAGSRSVSSKLRHLLHQHAFICVAQHQVDLLQGRQLPPRALCVAARRHNERIGIASAGSSEGAPSLAVCNVGDSARVQDVYIGGLSGVHNQVSGGSETPCQRLGVGLVQLASLGFDSYGG